MREATELYSESEVSHRLVDRAIVELRATERQSARFEADVRDSMKDELFGLLAHLHFHEISSRELEYAAKRINEMRRWMATLESERVDLPR